MKELIASQGASLKNLFYLGQIALGSLLVMGLLWGRKRNPETGFKLREAERLKNHAFERFPQLAEPESDLRRAARESRSKRKAPPLQLTGISIDGAPHEILGVSENASPSQVNRAWRDLMKRYHPDLVGRPGSREWQDSQRIAEAINRAKDEMTERKRRA